MLGRLVAPAEKDDENFSSANEIDAVAGTIVDPQFANATADRLYISGITERQTSNTGVDAGFGPLIPQSGKSIRLGRGFPDFDHVQM